MKLCSDKTRLLIFHTKDMRMEVDLLENVNPIKIDNEIINFSQSAEHLGMVRSTNGNLPTILDRLSAHRKAMAGVLHTGIGRSHRGNPAASLRIQQIYGNPVLFSGLGPLIPLKQEITIIDQHHKKYLCSLQRLFPCTPM